MRPELSNFEWHVYKLSESDFDYTVDLIERIIKDRRKQIDSDVKTRERKNKKLKTHHKDEAGEEISDILYYNYIDEQFFWQFALWRLQGIFEGILSQRFEQTTNVRGLKAKLDQLIKAGIQLSKADYNEMLSWAKLRNALSHMPPEQFRPGHLNRSDLVEYLELIKLITKKILSQKNGYSHKHQL